MIDKETVKKVAELSRLYFSEEEIEKFTQEFSNIIDFVNMINELNTEGVEPSPYPIDIPNIPREDEIKIFDNLETIYQNFPQRNNTFIVVPKVIEK